MPLPLIPAILGGVALLTGAKGAHSGYKGFGKIRRAKKDLAAAQGRYEFAYDTTENARGQVNSMAGEYGALKLEVLRTTVKRFLDLLESLEQKGHIEALRNLRLTAIDTEWIDAARAHVIEADRIALGGVAAAGAGAAAGASATAAVGLFGTASTGAAITGLSGAAATNATLAWLGGGSLASGGLGMAGGTMVLGGIVAGPALLVGGWALDAVGERALTKAAAKVREADRATRDLRLLAAGLGKVGARLSELSGLIRALDQRCNEAIEVAFAVDFDRANDEHIGHLQRAGTLVGGLARALRAPVLGEDGKLRADSAEVVLELEELVEA